MYSFSKKVETYHKERSPNPYIIDVFLKLDAAARFVCSLTGLYRTALFKNLEPIL